MKRELASRPPLARMVRIHEHLVTGQRVNCARVASELEISARTILRDLEFMRDQMGLPIEYDASAHRYRYSQPVASEIFGKVAETVPPTRQEAAGDLVALPLGDQPAKHMATICERHGLKAEHVARAILGDVLADAVCSSLVMASIVRSARALALCGREAA